MARIGIKKLCYAVLNEDTSTALTYEGFKEISGLTELNISNGGSTSVLYADDAPYESASALGEIKVDLSLSELPIEDYCNILGHTLKDGVVVNTVDDVPKDIAIGFERTSSNGKKTRVWLVKGSFSEPDDKNKSKEDKVTFNTESITGSFKVCINNGIWKISCTEDEKNVATFNSFLSLTYLNSLKKVITEQ